MVTIPRKILLKRKIAEVICLLSAQYETEANDQYAYHIMKMVARSRASSLSPLEVKKF